MTEGTVTLRTSGGVVNATMGKTSEGIVIALVSAKELVKLPGIADRSLFSRNVRLYRGLTNVNKGLRRSLQASDEHPFFPAYHNGLTLLTKKLTVRPDNSLQLEGVGVVNGCQSLVTMFDNIASLTSKLRVVVKVVEIGNSNERAEKITYRSNNQNAVTMRDQRSTDVAMRSLQSRITDKFGKSFALGIRVGESLDADVVMDNTLAAQLITACYREQPWAAVRKVRLFEDDFREIFNRKTTPERVWLLHLIDEAVVTHKEELGAQIRPSFAAVRFTLAYLVTVVLRASQRGTEILERPERWVPALDAEVREALAEIALEAVQTLNEFIETQEEEDESFDPKTIFKSRAGVIKIKQELERDARRAARKGEGFSFDVPAADEPSENEESSSRGRQPGLRFARSRRGAERYGFSCPNLASCVR